jgi:hypothetical protein
MKFLATLALATLAAAAPSAEKRAPTPLDVKLEAAGNSAIKATVTNNGKKDLKVLKTGSILDTAPVEKAHVSFGGKLVPQYSPILAFGVLTRFMQNKALSSMVSASAWLKVRLSSLLSSQFLLASQSK